MIITFCGHADYRGSKEDERKILSILDELVGDDPAELYLGGYGGFDGFARECGRIYQRTHPKVRLLLITPYITPEYQRNHLEYERRRYDEIVYPPIEECPPRFAISRRNRWMVGRADCLICYITRTFGGAYNTYKYAVGKQKRIYNILGREI